MQISDTTDLHEGMFAPCYGQVAYMRHLNQTLSLGYSEEEFSALSHQPEWPTQSLTALTLVPYLGSVSATLQFLYDVATRGRTKDPNFSQRNFDEKRVEVRSSIDHPVNTMRWEMIDLGAGRDQSPHWAAQQGWHLPHSGIMAAAAFHPMWVNKMDGETVPRVWLPGFSTPMPEFTADDCAPAMIYSSVSGMLELTVHKATRANQHWAVTRLIEHS